MGNSLVEKKCQACEGGIPALKQDEVETYMKQIDSEWKVDTKMQIISKTYAFKNYNKTIAFVNAIAWIAEQEGHHPDLSVHYGKVIVDFTTHAVNGLTENDFICAAKIDLLQQD
jgi:4a-hydroxytetrahydrobiopterin dehydratase